MKVVKEIPISYPVDIYTSEDEEYDRILLALHGFQLDGRFMFKRYEGKLEGVKVIAPNGPFLAPLKREANWEARYGWYFYDPQTKDFYINYEPAARWLKELLDELNPRKKDVVILGYSQGGYLAPKVAQLVPECKKVVGVNCVFRSHRFEIRDDVEYRQLHCKDDDVVSPTEARQEFEQMRAKGAKGQFIEIPGEHFLTRDVVKKSLQYL